MHSRPSLAAEVGNEFKLPQYGHLKSTKSSPTISESIDSDTENAERARRRTLSESSRTLAPVDEPASQHLSPSTKRTHSSSNGLKFGGSAPRAIQ